MSAFNLNTLTSNYIRPCQILFTVAKLVEDYDTNRKTGSYSLSDEVNAISLAINQTEATEKNRKVIDLCKEITHAKYFCYNPGSGNFVRFKISSLLALEMTKKNHHFLEFIENCQICRVFFRLLTRYFKTDKSS